MNQYLLKKPSARARWLFSGAILLLSSLSTPSPTALASTEELKGVKGEITRQQQELSKQQSQLDKLQKQLKSDELAIAQANRQLEQTRRQLTSSRSNLDQYQTEQQALTAQAEQQKNALQALIKAYYLLHTNAKIDHFLSQDSKQDKDRITQYYQHLARQRSEALLALEQTNQQLEQKNQLLLTERRQVEALVKEQASQLDALKKNRASRHQTIARIRNNIASDKSYLQELKRNEARLKAEIAKAKKRNAVPMDGLVKQKGKLPWPVKGKVLHQYGTKQSGHINWKGMVIKASYEQPVKAIYSGTVVFSDYLRGYGLVMLIDHGKGDMSLYGYNQVLTKKEGDKVRSGEVIALAGDTGGQTQASLYFELRRNSQTQNPRHWLTR